MLLGFGTVDSTEAWDSIDIPTIGLLFGLMVVSAQLRLGGFYTKLTRDLAELHVSSPCLLALVIAVAALLSALLCNDIICLAMTPILLEGCTHRQRNPLPFLLGLACASNIGSAATLIGNPQNMLIGQSLQLSFLTYLLQAIVPVIVSLVVAWAILVFLFRGKWHLTSDLSVSDRTPYHSWQSAKGLLVLTALVIAFIFSPFPREVIALAAAGLLLMSRKMATRRMLGLIDWHLLILFCGLFVVNHAFQKGGYLDDILRFCHSIHIDLNQSTPLFIATLFLSNLVSNVPAVMLLLNATNHPSAGLILALTSTFAGNLLLIGSIANLIVVDQSARLGIKISWYDHLKIGVPVTFFSLLIAVIWICALSYIS